MQSYSSGTFCRLATKFARKSGWGKAGFYLNSYGEQLVPCEEIKIPVPLGHISGKWWGPRDQQPVLAIHGWQDNAGSFDNLAPLLANDISVFCIDLPGHGLSSHYPKGQFYYLFWDGMIIIRQIVKHFKWNKVKLLGHSLGGSIAFLYAASYPTETDSYISIDVASPLVKDPAQMVSSIGKHIDKLLKYELITQETMPCYKKEEILEHLFDAYHGSLTREGCETLMKRGMKQSTKDEAYYFTRDVRLKDSFLGFMTLDQVMEFASRITCNVMNIRGNPEMGRFYSENYDVILDKIQQTARLMERHVVSGTHYLHLNDADSVADIIRSFLLQNY